jgi:hypothetical protein
MPQDPTQSGPSLQLLENAAPLDHQQALRAGFDAGSFTFKMQHVNHFVPPLYDSIAVAYPSGTQEVYSYYVGGLSGTLVGTLTLNYTDSTKANLANAART